MLLMVGKNVFKAAWIPTIPDGAVRFSIQKPPAIVKSDALKNMGFDNSWVQIQRQ